MNNIIGMPSTTYTESAKHGRHPSYKRLVAAWTATMLSLLSVILAGPAALTTAQTTPTAPTTFPTFVHFGLRWLNTNQKAFGATLNISMPTTVAQSGWQTMFKFVGGDVKISEYWDNWNATLMANNQYMVKPTALLPDASGMYYFSFNGNYGNETTASAGLVGISLRSATLQPGPGAGDTVDLTTVPDGLVNAPLPPQPLPDQPTGNFISPGSGINLHRPVTVASANKTASAKPAVEPSAPASMVGLYVAVGLMGFFVLIVGAATITRHLFRRRYRDQLLMSENQSHGQPPSPDHYGMYGDVAAMAPVQSSRPTRHELLSMLPARRPDPAPNTTPQSMNYVDDEEAASETSAATGMNPPYASHQFIEDYSKLPDSYRGSTAIQQTPAIESQMHEAADPRHSGGNTTFAGRALGPAASRRYLADDDAFPVPMLPDVSQDESWH